MKKYYLILVTIAILAAIIVCVSWNSQVANDANAYFTTMIQQQRSIAQKQVDSIFVHKHTDVFPLYCKCKSHYVKGDIKKAKDNMFEDFMDPAYTEPKLPEDVISTYHVVLEDGYRGSIDDVKSEIRMFNRDNDGIQTGIQRANMKGLWQTGWGLGVRENWSGGKEGRRIIEYIVTPYAVSFRNNSYNSIDDSSSIDYILDNAYDFYTTDDQSNFKRSMVSNVESFINEPYIDNPFFRLEGDNKGDPFLSNISMYADYGTYMYNGQYYVFVKAYGRRIYELTLNKDYVKSEKEKYISDKQDLIYLIGFVSISILVIVWLVCALLTYREIKDNKQTLLKRILTQCNPKIFIKNYDSHLLEVANSIYSTALVTDANDTEEVLRLASLAESELGVRLVAKSDIRSLKKKCNPKHFMNPYNAEKVAIANELYTKLRQDKLSCAEFLEIKNMLNKLYEGDITHKRFPHLNIIVKGSDKIIIFVLIFASIIYYVKRCDGNEKGSVIEQNTHKTSSSNTTNTLSDEDSQYLTNRLITGSTPYDRRYGKKYVCPYNQCSGIKVTAPEESDIVVIIKRNNMEGNVISHGYIRSGESYQFDLPTGTYQTFFYYGRGWNPNKEMRNGVKGGFVKNEVYSKDKPQEIKDAVLSYVLQLQRDGNFSTQSSNSSELF